MSASDERDERDERDEVEGAKVLAFPGSAPSDADAPAGDPEAEDFAELDAYDAAAASSSSPRPAEPPGPPRAPKSPAVLWARRVVAGLAALWALVLAVVFALRVGFPLELEWMEGGSLHQAWRMQRGLPVYGPPSADFVPFLYTPLYPAVLAGLGKIFPLGYGLARGVSIASVIASCAALWRLVRFEGKPRSHAAIAIGLFLSGYVFGFRWLDIGRGDAMFLALTLWGLTILRESEGSWTKAVLAGVLVALAFWTKQTAAVFVLVSGLAGLLVAPKQFWAYAGTIALIDGGGVLLGQWLTEGWLWTWIYETHQSHAFNEERFRKKTWGMFLHASPFVGFLWVMLAGAGFGVALRRARQLRRLIRERRTTRSLPRAWLGALWLGARAGRGPIFWGLFACAGLLVSALGYSTQFAEPNAFIPGICFGAAFLAVAMPDSTAPAAAGLLRPRRVLELLALVLIGLQLIFALLVEPMYQPIQSHGLREGFGQSYAWQDPGRTLPSAEQRRRARELRATVEGLGEREGELLALSRPWWSILAGGSGHVGSMGINDVDERARGEILASLREELAAGRFRAVWIDGGVPGWLRYLLRDWRVEARLWGDARVRPMSGWMSEAGMVAPWRGEQLLLSPVTPREVPAGVEVIADFESGRLEGFEVERGIGFGRRAARSLSRGLPPIGPHGGGRLLSSAASGRGVAGTGELRSPIFELPAGGAVELLLGSNGRREGLAARLIRPEGEIVAELEIPRTRFDLRPVRWPVPEDLAGASVRLQLVDDSPKAALFADDLWLWTQAPP